MLALGIVVLFDVLRVFLSSVITLSGRAGETPPELMGLYVAAWFILPFLTGLDGRPSLTEIASWATGAAAGFARRRARGNDRPHADQQGVDGTFRPGPPPAVFGSPARSDNLAHNQC
jgi:hypothetical protein